MGHKVLKSGNTELWTNGLSVLSYEVRSGLSIKVFADAAG